MRSLTRAALLLALAAAPARAQGPGESAFLGGLTYSAWSFKDAVPSDSFVVQKAWQLTVPVGASVRVGRVTLDLTGATATGRVELEDGRSFSLSGLTDLRLRGVARVMGDRLLVTAGVTLPTGATRLAGHKVDALNVLGASALGFGSPAFGNGTGVTGGVVYAFSTGGWGLALGSSYEARSRYTPIEVQLAGARQPADFKPGGALRFSLGADRLAGQGRVSLLLAGEFYGQSSVSVAPSGGTPLTSRYTLGPQLSGSLLWDLGVSGFRGLRVLLSDRYRSSYQASGGKAVEGTSGNVLEAAFEMETGGVQGTGFYLRADGRLDSGLEVDNTIATAAMSSAALTVGLSIRGGRTSLLPYLRAQAGRLDTGPLATTAVGFGGGFTLTVRP